MTKAIKASVKKLGSKTTVTDLLICNVGMTEVPHGFFSCLPSLTSLDSLSFASLSFSSDAFWSSSVYTVSGNPLVNIDCIAECKELSYLCLDRTELTKIPDILFSSLTKLTVFSARWNKLEAVPDTIGCLSSIEQLSFGSNALKSIPDSIANLAPTLKVLTCLYYLFEHLSNNLCSFTALVLFE